MLEKIILNVPYKDKDSVKQLGAKWDKNQRVWYIPPGKKQKAFEAWLPKESNKPRLLISDIGLLRNIAGCWSCKGICTISALYSKQLQELPIEVNKQTEAESSEKKSGFFIFHEVSKIPEELADFISLRCPNYRLGKPNAFGEKFYRNHCDHCSIGMSDTRLHKKNGKGFNPKSANDTKSMQFIDLMFFDFLEIKADCVDYTDNKLLLETVTFSDYLTDYL